MIANTLQVLSDKWVYLYFFNDIFSVKKRRFDVSLLQFCRFYVVYIYIFNGNIVLINEGDA